MIGKLNLDNYLHVLFYIYHRINYQCINYQFINHQSPQSQRPIICYVCRQPGHLASKCPSSSGGQARSSNTNNKHE